MKLRVWVNETPVGWLEKDGDGCSFAYDSGVDPAHALSLTMPIRTKSYDTHYGLLPVFDANLPEGSLREKISKALSKTKGRISDMDILAVTGGNQIGRIRVLEDGLKPQRRASISSIDELLDRQASAALIEEIMEKYASRSGVSGAMPKVLLEEGDPKFEKPSQGHDGRRVTLQTRDYILKFDATDYPGLSINEYYGLEVARRAGCETSDARISCDRKMLAVKRFDEADGERLGFEDLACLNTKTSSDKYDGSMERDLFKRIEEFSGDRKRENLEELFRLCVVNIAVRNGDAHLKNFGVLFSDAEKGEVRLSPAYDIVTTTAYIQNDMMSLSLGGTKRWPKPKALMALGARAKLSPKRTAEIIDEVAKAVRDTMPEMMETFRAAGHADLAEVIATQWEDGLVSSLGVDPVREPEDPFGRPEGQDAELEIQELSRP